MGNLLQYIHLCALTFFRVRPVWRSVRQYPDHDGNLDADNAHAVLEYLAEFARDGGAVMLVTHDDRAAGYARRVVRMRQGRLVD